MSHLQWTGSQWELRSLTSIDFRTFGPEFESEQDDVEFIEIRDVLKETQVEEDEDAILEEITESLDDNVDREN
ncbi:hypothetical protein OUZ56_010109 [Daphnia magna]|uniref:Uncharacterized protein n=1 Tax=Daphnia magna TaxID=35525 RepID=A0ABR0AHT9_9CRUS|nr:hypothetical protein OUZ56_010109 [Daphnia magna]